MTPIVLLAHTDIGSLTRQRLVRRDLPPMTDAHAFREARIFAHEQILSAVRAWRYYTVNDLEWKVQNVGTFTEDGQPKRKIQIVIRIIVP